MMRGDRYPGKSLVPQASPACTCCTPRSVSEVARRPDGAPMRASCRAPRTTIVQRSTKAVLSLMSRRASGQRVRAGAVVRCADASPRLSTATGGAEVEPVAPSVLSDLRAEWQGSASPRVPGLCPHAHGMMYTSLLLRPGPCRRAPATHVA